MLNSKVGSGEFKPKRNAYTCAGAVF